jgi:uncharacterized protein YjbI with pentapeptide repeats
MYRFTPEEFNQKLDQHRLWFETHGIEGQRLRLERAELIGVDLSFTDLSGIDLNGADLHDAKLGFAKLKEANLFGANLTGANLRNADLTGAILSRAYLNGTKFTSSNLSKAQLVEASLGKVNLFGADLSGANLSRAHLNKADLCYANLNGANLYSAWLVEAKALGADFSGADLSNSCIQDWHISSDTKFDNVICHAIYLKGTYSSRNEFEVFDRRPSDPNVFFEPGEFALLVQQYAETVDLIFPGQAGLDWTALAITMENFKAKNNGVAITVQSIEHKLDNFVVKFAVPTAGDVDKGAIETTLKQGYEETRLLLEAQYRKELNAKDDQIAIYRAQNTQLNEIVKLMANRPVSFNNQTIEVGHDLNLKADGSVVSMGDLSGSASIEHNNPPAAEN